MKKANIFTLSAFALSAFMLNTASAQNDPASGGCFAASVSFFNQGQTALGTDVNTERSFPERALGAPNAQTPAVNAAYQDFVSLGFGGVLEVAFAAPIANGPGADIRIWESSASPSSERSLIEVSQDGLGYVPVGEITADGEVDFGDAFSDFIQFVRITDISNNSGGGQVTDGYDVDAVECLHGEYVAPSSCYAEEVVAFNQTKRNDGSDVDPDRSFPDRALGEPQDDATMNFVSLGFGGDITLKFGSPIKNGAGNDVRVIESSNGASISGNCARYPETIRAFASQDGCNFVYIGEGCQDTDFDLGSLAWAQYIKLVDISDINAIYQGTPIADAYDLDGIICLNGYEENPIPADLQLEGAAEVVSFDQGKQKNGNDVAAARSTPGNALGMPQGGDVINFYSLGFGGEIVLKFDYVIFDQVGNDLSIIETTYNNSTCETYPEEAMISVSLDNITWFELGDVCQDSELDLNGIYAIQYVKVKDRSAMSSFSGSADGYDVDGIVSLNTCSDDEVEIRIADNTSTPDEVASLNASPNPFKSDVRLDIVTGSNDNTAQITVFNFLGQNVFTKTINVASSSNVTEVLSLNDLKSGVYFVNVETNSSKATVKLIKN
ncbi:MAG: T9SS type A sorting domain-containing protein [Bacteroidia bacterium]